MVRATPSINAYELVRDDGGELPPFTAGAHLELAAGPHRRHYSICNDPAERGRYVVAVQLSPSSRGGSRFIHEQLTVGSRIDDWQLRNAFPLDESASEYVFVAGGIGITPIISMMKRARRLGTPFKLHYCARTAGEALYRSEIVDEFGAEATEFHFSACTGRWDPASLGRHAAGRQLYCCGPASLLGAALQATASWPAGSVHHEFFSADGAQLLTGSGAFEVVLASSGAVYGVPPGTSILRVLRQHGVDVPSACEAGACGTCQVRYLEGRPDHRDLFLSVEEQAEFLMPCVSRALSPRLTLDL